MSRAAVSTSAVVLGEHLSTKLSPYRVLDEPLLAFDAERADARHLHPLRGLAELGPHSRASFAAFSTSSARSSVSIYPPNVRDRRDTDGVTKRAAACRRA